MNSMSMNSYLYAPKDDVKHRKEWRELYSPAEAMQLQELIQVAHSNNVEFIYAISPGLDIAFSNPDDIRVLQAKLDQLKHLGCRSYALLFDDIDPQLSVEDEKHFPTSAAAQASISNLCHNHLGKTNCFLFCPTEYCRSRAKPSIETSEYLNIIGTQLHPDIHIMWTGTKVISKEILPDQLTDLAKVLRRRPLIWDNFHANDYDNQRIFLGPLQGRPQQLKVHITGFMTNPNCEFEVNHVAFHTLAEWFKCPNDSSSQDTYEPREALVRSLEAWLPIMYTEKASEFDSPSSQSNVSSTHRRTAVAEGILAVVKGDSSPDVAQEIEHLSKSVIQCTGEHDPVEAAAGSTIELDATEAILQNQEPSVVIAAKQTAAMVAQIINNSAFSQLSNEASSIHVSTDLSDGGVSSHGYVGEKTINPEEDLLLIPSVVNNATEILPKELSNQVSKLAESQTIPTSGGTTESRISLEELLLLVDLLYLPYEYGPKALEILHIAHWLRLNAAKCRKRNKMKQEWLDKMHRFHEIVATFKILCDRLNELPNRVLLYELYPYLWNIRSVLSIMDGYLSWLKDAPDTKPSLLSKDPPTWVLRGGLSADLLCILTLEEALDLLPSRRRPQMDALKPTATTAISTGGGALDFPVNCSLVSVMLVRPYHYQDSRDKTVVFDLCRRLACWHYLTNLSLGEENKSLEEMASNNQVETNQLHKLHQALLHSAFADLPGDSLLGFLLDQVTKYAFVVESESGQICGYAVAVHKAEAVWKQFQRKYAPLVKSKYANNMDALNSITDPMAKDLCKKLLQRLEITQMHSNASAKKNSSAGSKLLFSDYPAFVLMDFLSAENLLFWQEDVVKRLLVCLTASLKTNGVHGVHCRIASSATGLIDKYKRLGFKEISIHDGTNDICLGRPI